jgi:integrase
VLVEHRDRQRFLRQQAGERWQDGDLILCTSTGTPINPNNVTRSFERLVILSGVPRIRVHDMRHGAASLLLRAGIPAKVVQEQLGHASIAITLDIYSHTVENMQDQAAAAMSAVLKKALETG